MDESATGSVYFSFGLSPRKRPQSRRWPSSWLLRRTVSSVRLRSEPQIIGSALLGLGTGFALLAYTSTHRTNQPQHWALVPGATTALVGVSLLAITPGARFLDLASWVWPVLVAMLVASSFRGALRSLENWSRRALLYPALIVLSLLALGGAV